MLKIRLTILQKLVLVWISIQTLFIACVAIAFFYFNSLNLEIAYEKRVSELPALLSSTIIDPMQQHDYAGMQKIADAFSRTSVIADIQILDAKNQLIAESRYPDTPNEEHSLKNKTYDLSVPLLTDNTKIGSVRVILSKERLFEIKNNIVQNTLLVAFLLAILFSLLVILVAKYFTKPIAALANMAKKFQLEQSVVAHYENYHDEIGELYHSYHTMVDQIQAQFRVLEKNEQLIKEREELIIDAIESIPDAFGLFDAEDKLILCNQAYVKTFTLFDSFADIKGTSFEDLVRSSLKFKGELIDPNFEGDEEAWVARRAFHHRNPSDQGLVLQFASGKWLQVMERKTQSGGIVGIRTDVTSIKEAQNNIEKYAFYDSLTNLANRRLMLEKLEFARKGVVNNRGMCSVLIIDIDHFKMVNDTRGHDFGDKVLIAFAERMVKTIRKTDVASRLGGDEFLVLLNDLSASYPSALKEVHSIVDHLHKKLSEPYIIDNKSYSITPSIGATFFSGTTNTINDLLKEADLALYEAKKSGRNTIQFFDKTIYDEFMDHINTENMVRNAISNQMFVLHFQYVFNEARQVVGAETLLRLKGENDSLPDKLITIAEETGLIVPLGMWVIQSAFKQMVLWQEKLKIDQFYLSINISPRQFLDPNFLSDLETKLNQSGVNPNQICLELTENLFMLDIDKILGKIDVIKKLGLKLSIDDFGMKYSSLNYLKILPVDKIKIDKSFVKELAISKGDETIVKSILFLGQNFGFEVTAEGVENYSQFETLKAMGCQYFQGYFFHKPSLPDAIELDELTKGLQV